MNLNLNNTRVSPEKNIGIYPGIIPGNPGER